MKTRRKFGSEYKTKVVLEVLSERKTVAEIAQKHNIHPAQISTWKQHFLTNCSAVFESGESLEDGPFASNILGRPLHDICEKTFGECVSHRAAPFFHVKVPIPPRALMAWR